MKVTINQEQLAWLNTNDIMYTVADVVIDRYTFKPMPRVIEIDDCSTDATLYLLKWS